MLGEGGVGSQLGRGGRDYVREEPKRQSAAAPGEGGSATTLGGGFGRGARRGSTSSLWM